MKITIKDKFYAYAADKRNHDKIVKALQYSLDEVKKAYLAGYKEALKTIKESKQK
jgi:hypothetical protein